MTLRVHGGLDPEELRQLGIDPSTVLDCSAAINPYGPCEPIARAIRQAGVHRYPDPHGHAARRALATWLGVTPPRVVLGHGATELLWQLVDTLAAGGGRPVVIGAPAFGEVRAACDAREVAVLEVRGAPGAAFAANLEDVFERAVHANAALIYVCNPSTPVGVPMDAGALAALAARHPALPIVLDESFLSLSDHHAAARQPLPQHVIRLRSLTKDHAVPGIRVGYAIAPAALVERIEARRPAWMLSAPALAVAQQAPEGAAFVEQSRRRLADDRAHLLAGLAGLGLQALPSVAPYVAVTVPDAPRLRTELLRDERVLVRDCSSFGMPRQVRIAVRPASDLQRLLAALARRLG